ncbi:MAG: hypothetical protein FJ296_10890 [Planctomycetes bacterium]|nr:hypothetical protein [Planctomycetota bacterium]
MLVEAFHRTGDPRRHDGLREPGWHVLRRLAWRLAAVLALVAAGDALLRRALPAEALLPWMEREFASYTVKVARFAAGPAPDVAFLGNSRVHDGIVPEDFGAALQQRWERPARAYNLGLMNAKAAELAALARAHLPEPPPRRVVLGLSGTELCAAHDFQYASRFLWGARELLDWLRRTPVERLDARHVESWLESMLGRACYAFSVRDALRLVATERLQDAWHAARGVPLPQRQRTLRAQVGRWSRLDVLSPGGRFEDQSFQPNLPGLLAQGDVRIPPYSLGDASELREGADFPLLRAVVADLQARGCRVALVEVPPSPWLQERFPDFHGDLFRRRAAEFAAPLGVPFVPMPPAETGLDDASYVDANHLSRAGARRYTQLLFERLAATGFLDDG